MKKISNVFNFITCPTENNQTLISFVKRRFKTTPASLIYKLFRTKKIQVNQQYCRYYHYRLQTGDQVIIDDNRLRETSAKNHLPVKPTANIEITYEDENILIVNKEHDIEIHNTKDKNCLDNMVQHYLYQQDPKKYQKQKENFFFPTALHRLDKLIKGLVIYPKNAIAKKIIYNSINDKNKITKNYLAVCENYQEIQLPSLIEGYICKNEEKQRMEFSFKRLTNSKNCSLELEVIAKKKNVNLLKIVLGTGRKHQIRAALNYFQAPIIGDKKYGSKAELNDRIYLFAYQLEFNNLSQPLNYLNGKKFFIEDLKEKLLAKLKKNSF